MKTFKLDAEIAQKTENVKFICFKFRTIGPDSLEAFLKECAVGEKVKIEINSPGGSVIAGLAMANMIKNSKAHVIAHVVGIDGIRRGVCLRRNPDGRGRFPDDSQSME